MKKTNQAEITTLNQTTKDILKNSVTATIGLMLFAFGIYLVIQANIGVSPWDVLTIGISETFGIIYGNVSIAISVVIIILDAIVVGKTVDLLNYIDLIPKQDNIWISIPMMLLGFFIEGCTQYLYMKAGLCAGPRDSFQLAMGRRLPKIPIGVVNIFILAAVLIIGWFFHGPIGIGTLIAPFGAGIFQQLAFNTFHYEPKDTIHQDILNSFKVIMKKN